MKKNFLYLSFFAAAILVSCKTKEAEKTPSEEIVTEEVVVEKPVQDETIVEEKVPTTTTTKKTESKKEEKDHATIRKEADKVVREVKATATGTAIKIDTEAQKAKQELQKEISNSVKETEKIEQEIKELPSKRRQ